MDTNTIAIAIATANACIHIGCAFNVMTDKCIQLLQLMNLRVRVKKEKQNIYKRRLLSGAQL